MSRLVSRLSLTWPGRNLGYRWSGSTSKVPKPNLRGCRILRSGRWEGGVCVRWNGAPLRVRRTPVAESRWKIWGVCGRIFGPPCRGTDVPITASPKDNSDVRGAVRSSCPSPEGGVRAPDSPTLSVQLPSSASFSVQLPHHVSSFGDSCAPSQARFVDRGRYDHLSYGQLQKMCKRRGCIRKGSEEISKTRSALTDADASRRAPAEDDAMDTAASVSGRGAARLGYCGSRWGLGRPP